ncbi:MAG: AMP-binding protein [Spirochaetia bacterium]|nr:AMP-binding protein [Spirochaetia bacterium]
MHGEIVEKLSGNILDKLISIASTSSDHPALIDPYAANGSKYRSFDELYTDVAIVAYRMREKGIRVGDRVLIFIPYTYELFVVLLAVTYSGAVAVFADIAAHGDMINQVCLSAKPRAFIGILASFALMKNSQLRRVPIKLWHKSLLSGRKPTSPKMDTVPVDSESSALFTFTSGTTGNPKAADRSHAFLWRQHKVLAAHQHFDRDEVDLTLWPVFALSNLVQGVTSVIPHFNSRKPGSAKPEVIHRQIVDSKVTAMTGPPIFFEHLAEYWQTRTPPETLKRASVGGAPVFPALAQKLVQVLGDRSLEAIYGSTEAEPMTSLTLAKLAEDATFGGVPVGEPLPETTLRIMAEIETASNSLGRVAEEGDSGEIVVAGPHVLDRYFQSDEDYKLTKVHAEGRLWHRTGDIGYLKGGKVTLLGRLAFGIKAGEKTVYSFPFEKRMKQEPDVIRSALVGSKGNAAGFVQLRKKTRNLRVAEIEAIARDTLEKLDLPAARIIANTVEIPTDKRHNSRIEYATLLRQV